MAIVIREDGQEREIKDGEKIKYERQ